MIITLENIEKKTIKIEKESDLNDIIYIFCNLKKPYFTLF